METGIIIPSRLLPKTMQTTARLTGDDGTHQAGWWKGLTVSGNKTRFDARSIELDDIVIDRATGLVWPKDLSDDGGVGGSQEVWGDMIDYANALNFGGFTDWRLPNVKELFSLLDFSFGASLWPSVFDSVINYYYWTSTTDVNNVLKAYAIHLNTGLIAVGVKDTDVYYALFVRGGK